MTTKEIEELALKEIPIVFNNEGKIIESTYTKVKRLGYIKGFTKASELLYSENQVTQAYIEGLKDAFDYRDGNITPHEFDLRQKELLNILENKNK